MGSSGICGEKRTADYADFRRLRVPIRGWTSFFSMDAGELRDQGSRRSIRSLSPSGRSEALAFRRSLQEASCQVTAPTRRPGRSPGTAGTRAGGFIGEEDAIANHRRVNAAVSAGGPARRPAGLWPARTRRNPPPSGGGAPLSFGVSRGFDSIHGRYRSPGTGHRMVLRGERSQGQGPPPSVLSTVDCRLSTSWAASSARNGVECLGHTLEDRARPDRSVTAGDRPPYVRPRSPSRRRGCRRC